MLFAIRSQLNSLMGNVETLLLLIDTENEDLKNEECPHPKEFRKNLNTMGSGLNEHWVCELCGFEFIDKEG